MTERLEVTFGVPLPEVEIELLVMAGDFVVEG